MKNGDFTGSQFYDFLIQGVMDYRAAGVSKSLKINSHLNELEDFKIPEIISDAILADFVNFLAGQRCMDLAFHSADLKKSEIRNTKEDSRFLKTYDESWLGE